MRVTMKWKHFLIDLMKLTKSSDKSLEMKNEILIVFKDNFLAMS